MAACRKVILQNFSISLHLCETCPPVAGVGRMGLLGLVPHIDWLGMCLRLCRLIKEEQNRLIKMPTYHNYYPVKVQYKYERSRVMILQYIGCVCDISLFKNLIECKRKIGPNWESHVKIPINFNGNCTCKS